MNIRLRIQRSATLLVALLAVVGIVFPTNSLAADADKVIIGGSSSYSAGDTVNIEVRVPWPDSIDVNPVEIVLVVDASASLDSYIAAAKTPLKNFVDDLANFPGAAKVSVVTFGHRPSSSSAPNSPFTHTQFAMRQIKTSTDRTDLKNAINSIDTNSLEAYSDIRQGIIYGNSKFSTSSNVSKRYLVLVTDGLDNYPASGSSILGETSWNGQCAITPSGASNISGLRYDEFTILPGGDTSKKLDFSFNDGSNKHYISPCGYGQGDSIPTGSQFINKMTTAFSNTDRATSLQDTINQIYYLITPAQVEVTDRLNSNVFDSIITTQNPKNCSSGDTYSFGDTQKTGAISFSSTALSPSKNGTCIRISARVKSGASTGSQSINSSINSVKYKNVPGDILSETDIKLGSINISGGTFPTPDPTSTPIDNSPTPTPTPKPTPISTPPPSTKDLGLNAGPNFSVNAGEQHTSSVSLQYYPNSSAWSTSDRVMLKITGIVSSSSSCPSSYTADAVSTGSNITAGLNTLGNDTTFLYFPDSSRSVIVKPNTSASPGNYKVCLGGMLVGHTDIYATDSLNFTVVAQSKDLALTTESGISISTGTNYNTAVGLQYLPSASAWNSSDRVNHRSVGIVPAGATCPDDGGLRTTGSGPTAGISLNGIYKTVNFNTPSIPFTIQVDNSTDPGNYKICLYAIRVRESISDPYVKAYKELNFTVTAPPKSIGLTTEPNIKINAGATYTTSAGIQYLPSDSAWDTSDRLWLKITGIMPASSSCPADARADDVTSGTGSASNITAGIDNLGDGFKYLYYDTASKSIKIQPGTNTPIGDYKICLGLSLNGSSDVVTVDAINFAVTQQSWIQIGRSLGQAVGETGDVHSNSGLTIKVPINQYFFKDGTAGVVTAKAAFDDPAQDRFTTAAAKLWRIPSYPDVITTDSYTRLRQAILDNVGQTAINSNSASDINTACTNHQTVVIHQASLAQGELLNSADLPACAGKNIIFLIDGAATFDANVINNSNNITFTFIASGDITVDQNVDQLDGVYIFGHNFDGGGGDTQLVVNGSLIGLAGSSPSSSTGSFNLHRSLADNTTPALLIRYQPKYLFLLKDVMGTSNYTWSE